MAPFKGWSSSTYYTCRLAHSPPEVTTWILAIGCLEKTVMNFGLLLSIPMLFFYGVFIALFDKLARRIPSFTVPSRLGAVWISGNNCRCCCWYSAP